MNKQGRAIEVFLRSPDGKLVTCAEAAEIMGKTVNAVRCGCIRPKTQYQGWEIVRSTAPKSSYMLEETSRKNGPGYDGITVLELYEQYLWCRKDPQMLTIMRDFAGTRDVTPLIRIFERWRKDGRVGRAGAEN